MEDHSDHEEVMATWLRFWGGIALSCVTWAPIIYLMYRLQNYYQSEDFSGELPYFIRSIIGTVSLLTLVCVLFFFTRKPLKELEEHRKRRKEKENQNPDDA